MIIIFGIGIISATFGVLLIFAPDIILKAEEAKTKAEKTWAWPTDGSIDKPFDSNSTTKGIQIL